MAVQTERVIVRTYSAGVHYGTLIKYDGKEVELAHARRIWSWKGAFTLNEIANHGVGAGSKLPEFVPSITLLDAIEIIPVSAAAAKVLDEYPVFKP